MSEVMFTYKKVTSNDITYHTTRHGPVASSLGN